MAWQYSDYLITDDPTQRRDKLKLHIKEVADAINEPYSMGLSGGTWQKEQLQTLLATLKNELIILEIALTKKTVTIGRSRL